MITTIIAAHMGSKRLPGKTLMEINGKTCMEHVVDAVRSLNPVVATYDDSANRRIWELCEDKGIACHVYQGAGSDVLGRFNAVLGTVPAETKLILRVTPDCPMLTRDLVRKFYFRALNNFHVDTIYTNRPADPDGVDMELFSVEALRRAHEYATDPADREHVCSWIYRHYKVERFSVLGYEVGRPEPSWKISVDTAEEYRRVKDLMEGGFVFLNRELKNVSDREARTADFLSRA